MNNIENNKKIARRFFDEVLNRGNLSLIDEFLTDDYVEHEELPGVTRDRIGLSKHILQLRNAFPDLNAEVQQVIAEDERVAVVVMLRGTHKGDFLGQKGTGRKLDLPYAEVLKFKNGKIAEHWGFADNLKVMEQLQLDLNPAHN